MGQRNTAQEPVSDEPDIRKLSSRRRHTFLRGRYRWNCIRRQPPYDDVTIYYLEDLLWIARQRGWTSIAPLTLRARLAHRARALRNWALRKWPLRRWSRCDATYGGLPDLRGTVFEGIDLSRLNLSGANLQGATFTNGTDRTGNNVSCKLKDTKLFNADLRGARFENVDLSEAIPLDPKDKRTQQLSARFTGNSATPPTWELVPVYTRNELLWVISRDHDPRWLDLRQCDIYERDLDGLGVSQASFASARAWALVGFLKQNLAVGKSPFSDVIVHSWKDLRWLKLASAAGILPITLSHEDLSDLRGANLSECDFRGADLFKVDLRGAKLAKAKLAAAELSYSLLGLSDLSGIQAKGANFVGVKLIGARLYNAHLEGANLLEANLHRARLDGAYLCGARFSVADLRSATFRDACLEYADLRGARVNAATSFIDATVNQGTQWGDVVFHSTPLLEINWRNAKTLGDESILYADKYIKRSDTRNRHYRDVMRAYRQMYTKLFEQGFYGPSRRYRLREKKLVRQQLRENYQWYDLFMSWLAFFLIGYGEQPGKLLRPYFAVIALFAVIYHELAHRTLELLPLYTPDQLTWFQSLTLSASTFRGEPSFPPDLLQQHYIGKILVVLGVAETAIGTIILLAMTLLWARRLFGNETPVVKARKHPLRLIMRRFKRRQAGDFEPPTPPAPAKGTG